MKYCMALDGGGTKTDAILFEETGHIVNRFVGPGSNATDLGKEEAISRICKTVAGCIADFPEEIESLYGGLAGVIVNGDLFSGHLLANHRIRHCRIDDDGCSMISSTIGHRDGCGMVCGTGSSLFVRKAGEPLKHIGGKGYLIDTGGSGFELGRAAICMALRSVDGRCRDTLLVPLLAEKLGLPINDLVIPVVHRGGRPFIASLAPAVFAAAKEGDPIACEIMDQQAGLLADLTFVAAKSFEGDFPVVIGGGIAQHFPEYVELIRQKSAPGTILITAGAPPVYGGAVEAMWDAGLPVTEAFREHFICDYQNCLNKEK